MAKSFLNPACLAAGNNFSAGNRVAQTFRAVCESWDSLSMKLMSTDELGK
jgi:hypothetical protein